MMETPPSDLKTNTKAHNSARHKVYAVLLQGLRNRTEASFVSVIELEFCNNNLQILNSFFTFLFFCY